MKTIQSSLVCWVILVVFIAITLVFMINFYNKAVDEIAQNSQIVVSNRLNSHNYVQE